MLVGEKWSYYGLGDFIGKKEIGWIVDNIVVWWEGFVRVLSVWFNNFFGYFFWNFVKKVVMEEDLVSKENLCSFVCYI